MKKYLAFNAELIKKYMSAHNLSKRELCDLCRISMYSLNKMLSGNVSGMSYLTFVNVSEHTNIKIDPMLFRNIEQQKKI